MSGKNNLPSSRIEMLELMISDLKNEYTHMLFYLSASSLVRGLHRLEIREWLEEEASSEMEHVKEFSRLLSSFGVIPSVSHHDIPQFSDPELIIRHAIALEQEVCANYARRLDQIEHVKNMVDGSENHAVETKLPTVPIDEYGAWSRVQLFYEDQLMHSHKDLDELREWVRTDLPNQ